VVRARRHDDRAVPDRDNRLCRVPDCEPTAGTLDAASRPVSEEVGRTLCREVTGRSELLDVLVAAHERDREFVDEEKRERVPCLPAGKQRRPACRTLNRWLLPPVVRPALMCLHEYGYRYDVCGMERPK
jgi:hypothetical protein